jgi:hypothetical protein
MPSIASCSPITKEAVPRVSDEFELSTCEAQCGIVFTAQVWVVFLVAARKCTFATR